MANALGSSQPAMGKCSATVSFAVSMRTISLRSSMFTYTLPLLSVTAVSGLPPRGMVPTTLPEAASTTVLSCVLALKVYTRLAEASYKMASGRSPTFTLSSTLSVLRSKMTSVLSPPLVIKPRPSAGASATPCVPDRSGISPVGFSDFASTTMT